MSSVVDGERSAVDAILERIMQIIGIASQKGGSGKTTLAGHLAVQAEAAGASPVALIDTDPQGSLSAWWNAREAETPCFARTTAATLKQDVEQLRELGMKLLFIDTPPAIEATIGDVIELCDLVLIPVRPSPHDLRAAGATVELVERAGKPLIFIINAATPRARITNEAVMALSQHGTLAPVILHQRTGFAASMIDGRTVGEIKGEARSAEEIASLWDYISRRLNRESRPSLADALAPQTEAAQVSL
jgi:chromosome partitioning protein